jgi:hypothetical protein
MDEEDRLTIWVPDEYRNSLWWPGMRCLIGRRELSITTDFKDARGGTEWKMIDSEDVRDVDGRSTA